MDGVRNHLGSVVVVLTSVTLILGFAAGSARACPGHPTCTCHLGGGGSTGGGSTAGSGAAASTGGTGAVSAPGGSNCRAFDPNQLGSHYSATLTDRGSGLNPSDDGRPMRETLPESSMTGDFLFGKGVLGFLEAADYYLEQRDQYYEQAGKYEEYAKAWRDLADNARKNASETDNPKAKDMWEKDAEKYDQYANQMDGYAKEETRKGQAEERKWKQAVSEARTAHEQDQAQRAAQALAEKQARAARIAEKLASLEADRLAAEAARKAELQAEKEAIEQERIEHLKRRAAILGEDAALDNPDADPVFTEGGLEWGGSSSSGGGTPNIAGSSDDADISVGDFQKKWIGGDMWVQGVSQMETKDPYIELAWKACRVALHDVGDEVWDVGAAVISGSINGVTFFTGVPGGRVGSIIKDAITNFMSERGDVSSTVVSTTIGQFVDVGVGKAHEKYYGGEGGVPGELIEGDVNVPGKTVFSTDGLHPLEGGTRLQGAAVEAFDYAKGICVTQEVQEDPIPFSGKLLRSDRRNRDYDVRVTKTVVYDRNAGKGVIILEADCSVVEVTVDEGILWDSEERADTGRGSTKVIIIPFQGTGEEAKLGTPRMLTKAEMAKMKG